MGFSGPVAGSQTNPSSGRLEGAVAMMPRVFCLAALGAAALLIVGDAAEANSRRAYRVAARSQCCPQVTTVTTVSTCAPCATACAPAPCHTACAPAPCHTACAPAPCHTACAPAPCATACEPACHTRVVRVSRRAARNACAPCTTACATTSPCAPCGAAPCGSAAAPAEGSAAPQDAPAPPPET